MTQMSGGEALVFGLEKMGAKNLYGIMGTSVLGFFDALYAAQDKIHYISCRHEQVAASMADVEGRLTGLPGIAIVHSGPGALNALISVANAYKDCSPMILITGAVKSRLKGTDGMLEAPHLEIFKPLVKGAYRVTSVEQIPTLLSTAYQTCLSGARGPVLIEVPEDIWREHADIDTALFHFEVPPATAPTEDPVRTILAALMTASRPLILAGYGVAYAGASSDLLRFVETLNIPVVTTGNGRGVVSEDHPLSLGRLGFGGGSPVADAAFQKCDVLLTLGCGVSDMVTYEYSLATDADVHMINLDPESTEKPVYVESHLCCDVGLALQTLNRLVAAENLPAKASWSQHLDEARASWQFLLQTAAEQLKSPLSPSYVFSKLDAMLSPQAITCGGAGMHVVYANDYLKARGPHQFLAAVNFGAMGFGMAAAMAAKQCLPAREVIAVLGDGEFMMALQDLETVVREKLAIKIFIVNDNSYRVLEFKQRLNYQGHVIGTQHKNPDFMKLADAFGLPGIRLDKPADVEAGIARALKQSGPVLIEIVTDPEDLPPTNVDATIRMGQV